MASLKQITIGTTSYDIIPNAITDSNANYKASCPAISSDTTVEVDSNKTTVINSSSTDNQYPSAKAVFTAIQNASREGSFASNILTSESSYFVPLVSSGGMLSTTYLRDLWIPENKVMNLMAAHGGSTINSMYIAGCTISEFILNESDNTTGPGKITKFETSRNTKIGDSTIPTTSDPTIGQNGLYGNCDIYISATGASDPSTSSYAFKGSIVNKAGVSSSVQGGYISSISNGSYATIGQIRNVPYSNINEIFNQGTITKITNSGNIPEIVNTGHILALKMNGSGTADILVSQGNTTNIRLGTSPAYPPWDVVNNGKFCPWQEVSNIDSLITFLNLQTGILYKYTGSTTTYNGVTYTNGNFYRYEA